MGQKKKEGIEMNEQIEKVINERKRQDKKWGEQNHSPMFWLSIIGEEFGEMCKEANEYEFSSDLKRIQDLQAEAIQCAACCVAMAESLGRNLLKDLNDLSLEMKYVMRVCEVGPKVGEKIVKMAKERSEKSGLSFEEEVFGITKNEIE